MELDKLFLKWRPIEPEYTYTDYNVDTTLDFGINSSPDTSLGIIPQTSVQRVKNLSLTNIPQKAKETATLTPLKLSEDKKQWKEQLKQAYIKAGASELYAKNLVGLDALETGWGKAIVGDYNYGNIKAGKSWTGKTRRGYDKREKSNDPYRCYNSLDEYVKDKLNLLKSRYEMTGSESPTEFATKLKKHGYATGSNYVERVVAVIKSVK